MLCRLITLALVLIASRAIAQSTQPASQPSTNPSTQLSTWFDQLEDKDADVRDAARASLMSLPRSRLAELERAVAASPNISTGQVIALEDIVQHVFLTGEPYTVPDGSRQGFLGVRINPSLISIPDIDQDNAAPNGGPAGGAAGPARPHVVVETRMPGFPAYPLLRDGDVIAAIRTADGRIFVPTSQTDLTRLLQEFRAGRTVEFDILRDGKRVRIPIKLTVAPAQPGDINRYDDFLAHRTAAAKAFWDDTFAKMLAKKGM